MCTLLTFPTSPNTPTVAHIFGLPWCCKVDEWHLSSSWRIQRNQGGVGCPAAPSVAQIGAYDTLPSFGASVGSKRGLPGEARRGEAGRVTSMVRRQRGSSGWRHGSRGGGSTGGRIVGWVFFFLSSSGSGGVEARQQEYK